MVVVYICVRVCGVCIYIYDIYMILLKYNKE